MEWLGELVGAGAAVASGGLFGMVGSVVGVVAKHYQEKARQEWEKKKWTHEENLQKLQMAAKAAETEQEIAIVSSTGAWEGLNTSIKADTATSKGASQWATNIKTLFRPFLTLVLWIIASWIFYLVTDILLTTEDNTLAIVYSAEEAKELIKYMVYTVFFTAASATTWWFGDRALTPPGMKHR